jgi:amidase
MEEIVFRTAGELAQAIRDRELSSADVVDAHLGHVAEHNSKINAIVTLDEEGARERAREADEALARDEAWGPLHGVPVTIKDTFEVAGVRKVSGFKPLAEHVPVEDAAAVAKLRAAGAVILGKTNTPLLTTDWQTHNPVFGRTSNPWNVELTVGGSTGGGGAAVAAGLSALELGGDVGGSARIPAHFCGVFGLKPTQHAVSTRGHIPDLPVGVRAETQMLQPGPLARSAADIRLALRVIAGPDPRRPVVPPVSFEDHPAVYPGSCRIAWTDGLDGLPSSTDTAAALEKLTGDLAAQGCTVERQVPPGIDWDEVWSTWGELVNPEITSSFPTQMRALFRLFTLRSARESVMNRGWSRGWKRSRSRYFEAIARRDAVAAKFEAFLEGWDAWLIPTVPVPAFSHCKPGSAIQVDDQKVPYMMAGSGFTCIASLAGLPAVTVPGASSSDGLPIGVQLVGRRWDDMRLLAIAERLAELTGGYRRPPGY